MIFNTAALARSGDRGVEALSAIFLELSFLSLSRLYVSVFVTRPDIFKLITGTCLPLPLLFLLFLCTCSRELASGLGERLNESWAGFFEAADDDDDEEEEEEERCLWMDEEEEEADMCGMGVPKISVIGITVGSRVDLVLPEEDPVLLT